MSGEKPHVRGQQRVVDVQRAVAGQVVDVRRDPRTPVVGDDDVRLRLLEAREQLVVVRPVADHDRHAVLLRQVGDRVAPDLLVGVLALGVRHDEHHVVFGVQERLEGAVAPGLIAEHDDPHMGFLLRRAIDRQQVKQGLPNDATGLIYTVVSR